MCPVVAVATMATTPTDPGSQQESMAHANGKELILVPNDGQAFDCGDDGFVNMPIIGLVHMYGQMLTYYAVTTKFPRSKSDWDPLINGLTILQTCCDILQRPSNTGDVILHLRSLRVIDIRCLSNALSAVFETHCWMSFEQEAVENGDFEISAVVWALMLGVRGLHLDLVKGKSGPAAALAAEEAWIAKNEDRKGYEKAKDVLKRLARAVVHIADTVAMGGLL
ncbi:hypothetical protein GMOD_00003504 [Pyrenophora seminiperda CCB06]|uniref:Uncharacterized protein n=1 Tax=Pyrenophora seminiperda CCB06 TaxID=1302712 RepID=A0A3M7MIZ7_9PLEO|nr:hypothetical protein GMOD_00003504 [Pyrenophora seminiperda CCB06]